MKAITFEKFWEYFFRLIRQQTEDISFLSLLVMVLIVLIVFNLVCMIYNRVSGKTISFNRILPLMFLLAYICFMLHIAIFSREAGSRKGIEIELNIGSLTGGYLSVQQLIYNILNVFFFVPFGFFLGWQKKGYFVLRRIVICTLSAFLASFTLEVTQLSTQRGFFELMDILTNISGGFIGVLLISAIFGITGVRKVEEGDRQEP